MFEFVSSAIDELVDLMISNNCRYRIDIEYSLDNWINTQGLLKLYNYDIENYTERLSRVQDGILITRICDYVEYNDIENRVKRISDNKYDTSVVLKIYKSISNSYGYIPYREYNCMRYSYDINGIIIQIKVIEDKFRLDIHIHNFASIDNLKEIMSDISCTLFNSDCIISSKIFRVLIDYYTYETLVMPKTITKNNLYKLSGPYLISGKLDGERRLVCVTIYGTYSINRNGKIFLLSSNPCTYWKQSILDCEYYNDKYYIIDAMMIKNESIRSLSLPERIIKASTIHKFLPCNIFNKKYYVCNNHTFWNVIYEVLSCDDYDGIVLTRSDMSYTYCPIKIKKNNTCDLLFDGIGMISNNGKYYSKTSNTLIKGKIYECIKINNIWMPIKIRNDKNIPNSSKVINMCNNACTLYDILSPSPKSISIYTDEMKSIILSTHMDDGILLDIGTGYGTDVSKWIKYSHVYVIERDVDKIKVIESKLVKFRINNYTIICSDLGNYDDIMPKITHKINCITIFFSFMFFTDDCIESLYNIIRNLTSDRCVVDIITLDKESIINNVDNKHIVLEDDNYAYITIPHTNINKSKERLYNTNDIINNMQELGFSVYIVSNLRPMFAMRVSQSRIISSYIYLGFNKGAVRYINIGSSKERKVIYTINNNDITITLKSSKFNLIVNGNNYYISDHKVINLF